MLLIIDDIPLLLLILDTAVDLDGEAGAVHGGHEPGRLGEEVAHLLEGPPGSLGEDGPEEDGVGEVADLKGVSKRRPVSVVTPRLTMKRMYHFQPIPVTSSSATDVVCPIMVLKAKLVIVAIDTPWLS